MPTVRRGHNFHCGNCKRKIDEGEDYYANNGDIFGYCFNCFVNPSSEEQKEAWREGRIKGEQLLEIGRMEKRADAEREKEAKSERPIEDARLFRYAELLEYLMRREK